MGFLNNPMGISVDSANRVHVADTYNNRFQRYTSSGSIIGAYSNAFNLPRGIGVDTADNIYVADTNNNRIQKFSAGSMAVSRLWGTAGVFDGQFYSPYGVAVDTRGNIYVADTGNHRIQQFNSSGNYTNKWGVQGAEDGQFNQPQGVAVDASGNIYVADTLNNRIQVFAIPAMTSTAAADNISFNSAALHGALIARGSSGSANVSFQWGAASGNLTWQTANQTMVVAGDFSANITGLSANTTYYFRTAATSGNLTSYGSEIAFSTAEFVLSAETAIYQGISSNFTGVVAINLKIDRIKKVIDNSTASIPGGISGFNAVLDSTDNGSIQYMNMYGVLGCMHTFDNVTGTFSVSDISSPAQPNNTIVAELIPVLTGNATTAFTLTINMQAIQSAEQVAMKVPEADSNNFILRRGDATGDGQVNISDALAIAQYRVAKRTLSQINALNAASVVHDGDNGDKITISDALAIAQYRVGKRDSYFR